MNEFVNTTDVLGDDAVCDGIILNTITEYADSRVTSIGEYAFYGCTALQTVDLPNAVSIGVFSFENCTKLKTINIPKAIDVGNYAFAYNNLVESVNIPSVTIIGRYAFHNCQGISGTLDLPNVVSIGANAFTGCPHIEKLVLRSNVVCELGGTNTFTAAIKIYVPDGLVEEYSNATNWSAIAHLIYPISEMEG